LSGEDVTEPDIIQSFENMIRYLEDSVKYLGENQACNIMRSRLGWFVKGMPFSSHFRESIKKISSEDEAKELIKEYRDLVKNRMDRKDPVSYSNE
jgi:tRNA-dihydrouridine synthase